jgi:hypothetical protein
MHAGWWNGWQGGDEGLFAAATGRAGVGGDEVDENGAGK